MKQGKKKKYDSVNKRFQFLNYYFSCILKDLKKGESKKGDMISKWDD